MECCQGVLAEADSVDCKPPPGTSLGLRRLRSQRHRMCLGAIPEHSWSPWRVFISFFIPSLLSSSFVISLYSFQNQKSGTVCI